MVQIDLGRGQGPVEVLGAWAAVGSRKERRLRAAGAPGWFQAHTCAWYVQPVGPATLCVRSQRRLQQPIGSLNKSPEKFCSNCTFPGVYQTY